MQNIVCITEIVIFEKSNNLHYKNPMNILNNINSLFKILDKERYFIVFLFLILLFANMFFVDILPSANTNSRAIPMVSFYKYQTLQMDSFAKVPGFLDYALINNHYYTDKPPLPMFASLPFYYIIKKTGIINETITSDNPGWFAYWLGGFLTGAIPFVLIITIIYSKLRALGFVRNIVIMSVFPLIGSFIFVFAQSFYSHIFAALLMLLSYIYLKEKRFALFGLFAGLAFLCEFQLIILIGLWFAILLYNERKLKPVLYATLSISPSIIFILIYNYIYTGSPFDMLSKYVCNTFKEMHSYYGFRLPSLKSLWGLTFSPYRGMFIYMPILFVYLYYFIKNDLQIILSKKIFSNYIVLPFVIYLLYISSYFYWHAGATFGPRYFMAILIILNYASLVRYYQYLKNNMFFYLFASIGIIISFIGKITTSMSLNENIANPIIDKVFPMFTKQQFHPFNIFTQLAGISPIISYITWIVSFVIVILFVNQLKNKSNLKN